MSYSEEMANRLADGAEQNLWEDHWGGEEETDEEREERVQEALKKMLEKEDSDDADNIRNDTLVLDYLDDLVFALIKAPHVWDKRVIEELGKLMHLLKDRAREHIESNLD